MQSSTCPAKKKACIPAVRHYRRAREAEELSREALQQKNRVCTYSWDDEGSLLLRARLPAEAGVLLLKALDLAMAEIPAEPDDPAAEVVDTSRREASTRRLPPSVRRADALATVAESFIENGTNAMNGGDKHQIVVHVSAETLRDAAAGCCEFEHGPSMPAETARRLACDASVVALFVPETSAQNAATPDQRVDRSTSAARRARFHPRCVAH